MQSQMVRTLPILRPDSGGGMAKPNPLLCSLQQTAETGNAYGLGGDSSTQKTISLDELLQTDCSNTERIMPAVLIVDDDHAFRTVLRPLFEEDGGFDNCVEARNASEAPVKSKQRLPNLAVVDFSMPEMNGLQLARELRAREPDSGTQPRAGNFAGLSSLAHAPDDVCSILEFKMMFFDGLGRGNALHFTGAVLFRTIRVVFPSTRMRHTQPRRVASCSTGLGREARHQAYAEGGVIGATSPAQKNALH